MKFESDLTEYYSRTQNHLEILGVQMLVTGLQEADIGLWEKVPDMTEDLYGKPYEERLEGYRDLFAEVYQLDLSDGDLLAYVKKAEKEIIQGLDQVRRRMEKSDGKDIDMDRYLA